MNFNSIDKSKYYFYKLKSVICSLNYPNDSGWILLTQYPSYIKIEFKLKNVVTGSICSHVTTKEDLSPMGSTDINIYEYGDERNGYNTVGKILYHICDIYINSNGTYNGTYYTTSFDINEIIGRSIIINNNNMNSASGIIVHTE